MYRYLLNPFMAVTTGNFKRALIMGRDHRDKLGSYANTEADLQALYQEMNLAYTKFETAYSNVHANEAVYRGHTQILEELMQELMSQKIREWDIAIQGIFLDNTAQYKMLLPNNRKPFQQGAYELRIAAVRTLEQLLGNFAQLSAAREDVAAFLTKLNNARTRQQELEALDSSVRQELEAERVELCLIMHRIFTSLVAKHYRNPKEVERYYEMKYLQSPAPAKEVEMVENEVSVGGRLTIFEGKLTANSHVNLKNTGSVGLRVFSSSDANASVPNDALTLEAGASGSFYSTELSDGQGYNWLIVVNENAVAGRLRSAVEEIELE